MNAKLEKAMYDIEKVDALMYAIENSYLDLEVPSHEAAKLDGLVSAFYALWDEISQVAADINDVIEEGKVVDAIYAVNDVRRAKN